MALKPFGCSLSVHNQCTPVPIPYSSMSSRWLGRKVPPTRRNSTCSEQYILINWFIEYPKALQCMTGGIPGTDPIIQLSAVALIRYCRPRPSETLRLQRSTCSNSLWMLRAMQPLVELASHSNLTPIKHLKQGFFANTGGHVQNDQREDEEAPVQSTSLWTRSFTGKSIISSYNYSSCLRTIKQNLTVNPFTLGTLRGHFDGRSRTTNECSASNEYCSARESRTIPAEQ
jgi:hypothetical protein